MSEAQIDEARDRGDVPGTSLGLASRWLLVPLALLGLALLWRIVPVSDWFDQQLLPRIDRAGWAGYLVFAAVYVAAVVLMAPATVLTITGGYLFGPLIGGALALGSAVTGASLAFLIARRLAREAVRHRVESDHRFRAIDRAVARKGAWVVLLLRLSPIIPFNMLNYALGVTGVRFPTFVLASGIGMIPGTAATAFIGASASDRRLADLGWGWWAVLLTLALSTGFALAVMANRALIRAEAESESDSETETESKAESASGSTPPPGPQTRPASPPLSQRVPPDESDD